MKSSMRLMGNTLGILAVALAFAGCGKSDPASSTGTIVTPVVNPPAVSLASFTQACHNAWGNMYNSNTCVITINISTNTRGPGYFNAFNSGQYGYSPLRLNIPLGINDTVSFSNFWAQWGFTASSGVYYNWRHHMENMAMSDGTSTYPVTNGGTVTVKAAGELYLGILPVTSYPDMGGGFGGTVYITKNSL